MSIKTSLKQRRSYYNIGKELPVEITTVIEEIQELTELVPDAFNMKSSRIVAALGDTQDLLWDTIYDAFSGAVSKEKIAGFKAGAGSILYFYDEEVVVGLQQKFPRYANRFPEWAMQSSGMLQLSIWSRLRELGIGASLQHYNPVIDDKIRALFGLPESYVLIAQMPFGGIGEEPEPKLSEDITKRVQLFGV